MQECQIIYWIIPLGAFLIPYTMMVLLLGAPLVCLECIMGQYVGIGALPFYNISPLFKGVSLHIYVHCHIFIIYFLPSQKGFYSVVAFDNSFLGLGYSMMILSVVGHMVYMVVIAYIIFYFVNSFSAKLPWTHCDNPWNTANCMVYSNESGKVDLFSLLHYAVGLYQHLHS